MLMDDLLDQAAERRQQPGCVLGGESANDEVDRAASGERGNALRQELGRLGIVAAVEPKFASLRRERRKGAGRQALHACRPVGASEPLFVS